MVANAAGCVAGAIPACGEAVLLTIHGISDIDGLHTGKYNEAVQFYAF
jgi:hypothetical protein